MAKFISTITFISLILIFFSSLSETQSKIKQIDQKNKIIKLTNFILQEKGVINKIEIVQREDGQRIVLSTDEIEKHDVILKIPYNIMLSPVNPDVKNFCIKNKISLEFSDDCYMLFMHNEKKNIEKSRYKAFLDNLPTDFKTLPINYKQEEREILKKSFLYTRLLNKEKYILETFERIKKTNIKISYQEFYTLYENSATRAFYIYEDGFKLINGIVPYADMFNSSFDSNPAHFYFDENFNLLIKALRNIKKGEEVTFKYLGHHQNSKMLLNYGFTSKDNPYGYIPNFEVKLRKKNLQGEIDKIKIGLWINPKLISFKIFEFRSYLENSPLKEGNLECKEIDLKIFTIIRDNIKEALTKYKDPKINPDVFEKFEAINMKNIYRVLFEEKKVLEKNLLFIGGFVEAMETKYFDKLRDIVDFTNEYDFHYYSHCAKMANLL